MSKVGGDALLGAIIELTEALSLVERIRDDELTEITYETMQRSGFTRKNWKRKYNLADARRNAAHAATRLRNVWELLDPMDPRRQADYQRTVLGNCQEQLHLAIGHLQEVLNKPRTHGEQQLADTAAREWLLSIGSEPT